MHTDRLEILAHRTGRASAPGNSLRGMELCHALGANGLECDVTFVDGVPFVWIDDMNDMLSEATHAIASLGAKKVRRLRRKDCEAKILEIDDVWRFMDEHPNIKVYFDVKFSGGGFLPRYPLDLTDVLCHFRQISTALIDTVIQKIAKPSPYAERIGFTTFCGGAELLRAVKSVDQRISTDLIAIFPWTAIDKYAEYLSSVTIGWKNLNQWKLFSTTSLARIMGRAHRDNLRVYGGLVNTADELGWLLKHDFDGLWTDNVPKIQHLLGIA